MATPDLHPIDLAFADGFALDPYLTVTEWADEYRYLPAVAAAEHGRYRSSRTPYVREIGDLLSARSEARRVVWMKGSQIGATELANNWIGYIIHHVPAPTLMIQPTDKLVERVSKQRIAPMIAATPVLRERVASPRSRDSSNTITEKEFPNGILVLTGARSAANLRSMPIRNLIPDELDGYEGDVDGEGDPLSLAEKRQSTYSDRAKTFIPSTPLRKGHSRVELLYFRGDRRRFMLHCPNCRRPDYITWSGENWVWPHDEEPDGESHYRFEWNEGNFESIRMVCPNCEMRIPEAMKTSMFDEAFWKPTNPRGRFPSFHLSGLYSPLGWKSWAECLEEWFESKNDPLQRQVWTNTVLGETYEEAGDSVGVYSIISRREQYKAQVPHGVGGLVASVDTQGDRLEVLVRGFGAGEESWLIDFQQLWGDPAQGFERKLPEETSTWHQLTKILDRTYLHESGRGIPIDCCVIDTGGHATENVYRYVKAFHSPRRRVFAIKGDGAGGKPLIARPTTRNRYRVPMFMVCVDTGKSIVLARLQIPTPGPGFMHFPLAEWLDVEYFEQLVSEKRIHRYVRGRGSIAEWIPLRERNEALDLEDYALCGLYIMGRAFISALDERAKEYSKPLDEELSPVPAPARPRPIRPNRPRSPRSIIGKL